MEKKKSAKEMHRHYQKIAAAIGSAALLTTAVIPSIAVITAAPEPHVDNSAIVQEAPQSDPSIQVNVPEEVAAKQVIDVNATAYAPGSHDNDQWGTKTRIGTEIRPGVIAVDPRIIPLGSHVIIKYPDGSKEYAVAEDTGGAIKGHRIDVARWTVKEANKFGIKPVKVYVMHTPEQQDGVQV